MENKFWISYHITFWDRPLSGVGVYGASRNDGVSVYFEGSGGDCTTVLEKENICSHKSVSTLPTEIQNFLHEHADNIFNGVGGFTDIVRIGDYIIECNDEFDENGVRATNNVIEIYNAYKYDLYTLDPETMEAVNDDHKVFQKLVGYHTDHDPKIYKAYDATKAKLDEYYSLPSIDRIKTKKYLCTSSHVNIA